MIKLTIRLPTMWNNPNKLLEQLWLFSTDTMVHCHGNTNIGHTCTFWCTRAKFLAKHSNHIWMYMHNSLLHCKQHTSQQRISSKCSQNSLISKDCFMLTSSLTRTAADYISYKILNTKPLVVIVSIQSLFHKRITFLQDTCVMICLTLDSTVLGGPY